MDPNISPSGQQPDDQSQAATATAEPPQQQQPQAQQVTGPFSAYLDPSQTREPTHTASQQRPSGFMGPAGKMAFFADQFLAGVAKGRANAYNRSIQQQAVTYKRLDQAAQDIQSNPTLTDEDKQGLLNKLYQFKASAVSGATDPNAGQGEGGKKKGKKDDGQDQQNPVLKFIHEAATRLAGPGAQPQQITPQSVNQVLGEVYSGMSQKVGAKQQMEAANKEYMAAASEAINAVPEGKDITAADIWKNERYQKAHAKLAGLSPKGQIPPDLTKPLDEMMKRKSAKPYEAELPDGGKVPVTVDADGVVRDSSGTVMPGGSYKQLFRPGTEAKPTEKQVELDRAYASWSKTLGKDKLDDGEKSIVADLERTPNSPLSIEIQANLLKQKGSKNLELAKNQAILLTSQERQTSIAEKAANASLRIALERMNLDDKKNKYNPRELDDVSRSIINDVHGDGTPGQAKALEDLRKSASDPKDPKRTESAGALRKMALENVRDHPEFYQHLTDQQREQVIHHIDGMPVDKIVGRGGSAAAAPAIQGLHGNNTGAKPGQDSGRKTDDVPQTVSKVKSPAGAVLPKGQIWVQAPDGSVGYIPADKKDDFAKKHPGSVF